MNLLDFPLLVLVFSFVFLWLSSHIGASAMKMRPLVEEERTDLDVVKNSALTLLALLIGFSFSMAVSRYDQRKNLEEEEANAIGTEYARAGLLPAADAGRMRDLMRSYVDQRVLFYTTRNQARLHEIGTATSKLQAQLWSSVEGLGSAPNPVVALVLAGMNDVLNSEGYTQAAWWNRIPIEAWCLMAAIALCGSFLIGYGARRQRSILFMVLPIVMSIAFFLIADIDAPRGGLIRVHPQNLQSLAQSIGAH